MFGRVDDPTASELPLLVSYQIRLFDASTRKGVLLMALKYGIGNVV